MLKGSHVYNSQSDDLRQPDLRGVVPSITTDSAMSETKYPHAKVIARLKDVAAFAPTQEAVIIEEGVAALQRQEEELATEQHANEMLVQSVAERDKQLDEMKAALESKAAEIESFRRLWVAGKTLEEFKRQEETIQKLLERAQFWKQAAYGIHDDFCNKPDCMKELEAVEPKDSGGL